MSNTSDQRHGDTSKPSARRPAIVPRVLLLIGVVIGCAALYQFGTAFFEEGTFEKYDPDATKSRLAQNPMDHEARLELARYYLHTGNELLRRDRSMEEIVTDSELVGYFSERLSSWEDMGEEVEDLRSALSLDFQSFYAKFNAKQTSIARIMFERSILLFRQSIALGARLSAKNFYHLGTAYYQLGPEGYAGASKYLAKAVESGLVSTRALTFLGNVAMARGDLSGGISLYDKAIDLSPDDPVLTFNLALAYKENEEIDRAVEYFRSTLRLYGNRADLTEAELSIILQAHLALGWCLLKAGEYDAAEAEFEAVLAGQPASIEGHYWLGVAYERQRRYEAARAHWQNVRDLRKGFRDVEERLEALGSQMRSGAR